MPPQVKNGDRSTGTGAGTDGPPRTIPMVALWLKPPDKPAMVTTYAPGAAWLSAERLRELRDAVAGENVACTPLGRPDTDKATGLAKPPTVEMVTAEWLVLPVVRLRTAGDVEIPKSGTIRVRLNPTVV